MADRDPCADIDELLALEILRRLKNKNKDEITVAEMEMARKYLATKGYTGPTIRQLGEVNEDFKVDQITEAKLSEIMADHSRD